MNVYMYICISAIPFLFFEIRFLKFAKPFYLSQHCTIGKSRVLSIQVYSFDDISSAPVFFFALFFVISCLIFLCTFFAVVNFDQWFCLIRFSTSSHFTACFFVLLLASAVGLWNVFARSFILLKIQIFPALVRALFNALAVI